MIDRNDVERPSEENLQSIPTSKNIHINIFKKLMIKFESHISKDGCKTMAEALRAATKDYINGSLELITDMNESEKIKEILALS